MKADTDLSFGVPSSPEMKLFVGRFIRRQNNFGTVSVIGRVEGGAVDVLHDPKRLFPRGLVETHDVAHAKLVAGDWVAFEVVRHKRPRQRNEYKAVHLRRLPRFAVLPEQTNASCRALLTDTGWLGGRQPGLWALRISDDRVLVVELKTGKDGALRIPRKLAHEIRWYGYGGELVARLPMDIDGEDVLVADLGRPSGTFDWSDEVDNVAHLTRSLSDANDPRVADPISRLELHQVEDTDRVCAGTLDRDAAVEALRSGELAKRLHNDRQLMKIYLDAALQDDGVREAVAEWTREGHGAEAERLRSELAREITAERKRRIAELTEEIDRKRAEAFERVEADAAAAAELHRQALMEQERKAEEGLASKLKKLDTTFADRKVSLELEIVQQEEALAAMRGAALAAASELEQVHAETEKAQARLRAAVSEVDRQLVIADRLGILTSGAAASARGVATGFVKRPLASASVKGLAIGQTQLLTDKGKDLLRSLVILLMAGELPILMGSEVPDFLRIAEALICPGRSAMIEADPTIISVDDLWSRPGSGAPTAMAAATAAAKTGATIVTVRSIERSGARFWVPSLADALRGGRLPRGLLVCCTVGDRDHDEISALPTDLHWLSIEGTIADIAYLSAALLLRPPALELAALDPGPLPEDLSEASTLIAALGFKPPVRQALRIARMFVEAKVLLGDETKARSLVKELALLMADRPS